MISFLPICGSIRKNTGFHTMIFNRPLTADERKDSVRNLYIFNIINGGSYVCVGELIMILLAVDIGCPDVIVAALGTMLYLGFLMLPLGRIVAARIGAAKCDALFWCIRNFCALLFATSAIWAYHGHMTAAFVTVLLFSFGFYGCRAAGAVLQQPLTGEIALPEERAKIIGVGGGLFWASATAGLLCIIAALFLRKDAHGAFPSLLVSIICIGSILGIISSVFLARIHETDVLRESSRRPIMPDLRRLFRLDPFRRLLVSTIALNLASMLLVPTMLLVLKRGYGLSNLEASLWSVAQWGAAIVGAFVTAWAGRRYGPRREMIVSYQALLFLCAIWIFLTWWGNTSATVTLGILWIICLFMGGLTRMVMESAVTHYYLTVTDPDLRISGSLVLYTAMGAAAGIIGITISSVLMLWIGRNGATATPGPTALLAYRNYFIVLFALLTAAMPLVLRLVPLPEADRHIVPPHETRKLR